MIKISALTSTYDLILIPHAGAMHSGVHFSFSQSPAHTPMIEYLVKWMPILQFFVKKPINCEDGNIFLPNNCVGLGVEVDENKTIDSKEVYKD